MIEQKTTRWGQGRRLEFIEFRLLWERRVNRGELVDFFGISIQQASLDIAQYIQLAPQNLVYDRSEKTYKATSTFLPVVTSDDAKTWLDQLQSQEVGSIPKSMSFMGWTPPTEVVEFPARQVSSNTLRRILWAIQDCMEIQVRYQSMSRPESVVRWIRPHALASDGGRWHVRAWCSENAEFRDFVISRIETVFDSRASNVDSQRDVNWMTEIEVILKPQHGLTKSQHDAVLRDFGMKNGECRIKKRAALLFYLFRQLQIDLDVSPISRIQPIEVANADALRVYVLPAASLQPAKKGNKNA